MSGHNQFKPGDLALVIDASIESNLGMVVELIRKTSDSKITLPDGERVGNPEMKVCWVVVADGLVTTNKLKPEPFMVKYAAVPERCLMPLRGDFSHEQQKSREVLP